MAKSQGLGQHGSLDVSQGGMTNNGTLKKAATL